MTEEHKTDEETCDHSWRDAKTVRGIVKRCAKCGVERPYPTNKRRRTL